MQNRYDKLAGRVWSRGVALAVLAMLVAVLPARGAEEGPPTPHKTGKPLKMIILAGQSNMQEPAGWQTLKGLADSPETKPLYDKLVDETGKVRVFPDVRVTVFETTTDAEGNKVQSPGCGMPLPPHFGGQVLGAEKAGEGKEGAKAKKGRKGNSGGSFGPELGFGVTLYEDLQEPILIIKTAWGGKSLNLDFRPPTGTEWVPPEGHPDVAPPPPLPIPTSFELPADFQPPTDHGKNMQIFSGIAIGEVNGLYPIYVSNVREEREGLKSIPFEKGDLILGLNGEGLHEEPITQWRNTWFNKIRGGDWSLKITRWRAGKIETITIDTAQALEGGRAAADAYIAEQKAERKKLLEEGGEYYHMMIKRIKDVLADPGKYHPAYDPKQGYEIAGFVWFHGYNDIISSVVYPYGNMPRGYEQYGWLLAQLIRSVRKELNVPKMPVVIGVFGQGGNSDRSVHFREAQAAVAGYDEFKGTVVAVQTVGFVDNRIPEIQNKLDQVMQYKGDDPNHPYAKLQAEIRAYKEKMGDPAKLEGKERGKLEGQIKSGIINIVRTPEETEYLKNNASNQGYHYNGSPKFFVRAGQAFAKALSAMMRN